MLKNPCLLAKYKLIFVVVLSLFVTMVFGQQKPENEFWKKVQFGGGFGLSVGSGYTDISIAPSAIYNFNDVFAAGIGLQGSYVKVKDRDVAYNSYIYGGSLIGLMTPIEEVQLSVELEQLRVNQEFTDFKIKNNFWNTALYLGAGYYTGNVTIGVRYNVLYKKNDLVYSEAFMPFVRIYF